MAKTLPKIISIISALVLLFVINTRPLCVSAADTPDLTLVETELSASEVAELVAGEVTIGVILIIVGFIALTYVTLRNVDAPIQFNSTDSFFDKCQALGQYMLDNIDDNVKHVIYSVYEFVTAGSITSISSISKLNLTSVGQFFVKIGAWLGGSFVSSVNTLTSDFLSLFGNDIVINISTAQTYNYASDFSVVFNSYSGFAYSNTFGRFLNSRTGFSGAYYMYYDFYSLDISTVLSDTYFLLYTTDTDIYIYPCTYDGSTYTPYGVGYSGGDFYYATGSSVNKAPNLSSYSPGTIETGVKSVFSLIGQSSGNSAFDVSNILFYLTSLGYGVGYVTSQIVDSVVSADAYILSFPTVTSSSDTVTVPLSDELVLQIADVAAAAAAGTIATTKDYYDELIAGLALTITSALSGSNFTMPEGDYYIPSLDNIWKYVEYMFSTLGSWIIFAGKCIQCVTVGEGGLSWIFYGGFIFLICGGIVGKILLG